MQMVCYAEENQILATELEALRNTSESADARLDSKACRMDELRRTLMEEKHRNEVEVGSLHIKLSESTKRVHQCGMLNVARPQNLIDYSTLNTERKA
jgi:hypothetical protein